MYSNTTGGVESSDKNAEGERATNNSVVVHRKAGTFSALTNIMGTKPWKAGQLLPNSGRPSLINPSQEDALSPSFAKQKEIHVEQLTPSEVVGAIATMGCRATSDTKQCSAEPSGARPFRCSLIKPKTGRTRSWDAARLNGFRGSPPGLTVETVGRLGVVSDRAERLRVVEQVNTSSPNCISAIGFIFFSGSDIVDNC